MLIGLLLQINYVLKSGRKKKNVEHYTLLQDKTVNFSSQCTDHIIGSTL